MIRTDGSQTIYDPNSLVTSLYYNHCSCLTVSVDGDLLPQAGVAVVRLLHHRDELEVPVSLAEDQTDTGHDA